MANPHPNLENLRPPKTYYKPELAEVAYLLCAELGATDEKIAQVLGQQLKGRPFCVDTITRWKRDYPEFAERIQAGKDLWDSGTVESALLQKAKGIRYTEVTKEPCIVINKDGDKEVISKELSVTKEVEKFIPPDVTAAKFYLPNRNPKRWKLTQEHQLTGRDGGPIESSIRHEDLFNLAKEINAQKNELPEGEAIVVEPS